MYYSAVNKGVTVYFNGAELGENEALPHQFSDGQGSQALIVLRLLLTGREAALGDWSGCAITAARNKPEGTDVTPDLLKWLMTKPGNPMRHRDSVTGWIPTAEAAVLLDGLSTIKDRHSLAVALGRTGESDEGLASRLAERTGAKVVKVSVTNPVTEIEPVLEVMVGNTLLKLPFPFHFDVLKVALLKASSPELAWQVELDDVVI